MEQFVVAVIVLVSYICQIFFYCHYGNQIKHQVTIYSFYIHSNWSCKHSRENKFQSEKLFTSIYLCKWYDLNCNCFINGGNSKRNHVVAIKRSISIMLERTKAPIIVIAGRLIILSYDSYIMVCNMKIIINFPQRVDIMLITLSDMQKWISIFRCFERYFEINCNKNNSFIGIIDTLLIV